LKAKSSDTDGSDSEDSSSDSSLNSSRAKKTKEKNVKSPVSRVKTSSEVKASAKLPKSMHEETKKSKYATKQQVKPVVDFPDVSVLSFGDEVEAEKTGFDSKSFVDDLLSGEQETIRKKSPDTDLGDFFSKPSIVESPTESPPKPSIKPKTNDIMGLFKMESPAQVDIFSSAGPRAQEMRPIMRPQGPSLQTRTHQTAMTQNAQFGYPSVRNQPVVNQNMNQMFNQVTNSQTNPSQRFSNPKPQSSAFDALMRGNVPIKSQPPSARSLTSSYVPSKPAGPSLDIDLSGWMD